MKSISIAIILILLSPSFTPVLAQQTAQPAPKSERREMVYYARQLQEHINAQNTDYRHKAGTHFRQIHNIRDIRPGDLISLEYPDRAEHDDNTGHIMVVDGDPQPHRPSKVIAPNTLQYSVTVIDCSRSGHGTTDTRNLGSTSFYAGLGKGELRLYTNPAGDITGYSWSTGNPKPGFNPFDTPILIGRIDL